MPFYSVKNKETNEVMEVVMSYDDLHKHLEKNPHLERDWTTKTRNANAERKGHYKEEFSGHLEKIQNFYTTRTQKSTINPW